MKKNTYILISGFLAITFLFSSCQSLTNLSIEKRQHRGGYYVDWGNGKVKTDPVKNTTAKAKQSKDTPKQTAAATKPAANSESTATTEQKKSTANATAVNNSETKKARTTSTFKVKEEAVAQRESSKKTSSSFSYAFSDSDNASSSDTPTWVLAVLCILLPPLAVFLHLGIGTEFWISLILTLLFWIPGVIYAFIIIF